MIGSRIIPVILAAFCGLTFQSQANAANAESVTLLPSRHLTPGMALRSQCGDGLAFTFSFAALAALASPLRMKANCGASRRGRISPQKLASDASA